MSNPTEQTVLAPDEMCVYGPIRLVLSGRGFPNMATALSGLVASHEALRSQLTTAQAEIERLKRYLEQAPSLRTKGG